MVEAAPAQVSVLVVTYNSAEHLLRCLESIAQQDYPALEAIIIENASTDRTGDMLKQFTPPARIPWSVTLNAENRGFAAAQNQAIRQAQGDWLLCLNPDVVLRPDFIRQLVSAAIVDGKIAEVCGKLRRW